MERLKSAHLSLQLQPELSAALRLFQASSPGWSRGLQVSSAPLSGHSVRSISPTCVCFSRDAGLPAEDSRWGLVCGCQPRRASDASQTC